eukprot:7933241-Pyramimonas_sp.AAC.2
MPALPVSDWSIVAVSPPLSPGDTVVSIRALTDRLERGRLPRGDENGTEKPIGQGEEYSAYMLPRLVGTRNIPLMCADRNNKHEEYTCASIYSATRA